VREESSFFGQVDRSNCFETFLGGVRRRKDTEKDKERGKEVDREEPVGVFEKEKRRVIEFHGAGPGSSSVT